MQASTWQGTPARGRERGHLADRVEDAVRVGRRADDHQRRPLVEPARDRGDVGPAGDRVDRHVDDLEAEQVRGLVERRVGGDGQEQPRESGRRRAARHVSRAASTASRQLSVPPLVSVPTAPGPPPSSAQCGADQVVLDAGDARERGRVEGVGPLERGLGAGGELVDVRYARSRRRRPVRAAVRRARRRSAARSVRRARPAGLTRVSWGSRRAGSGRARARRRARAVPGTTVKPRRTASHARCRLGDPRPRSRTRSRPGRAGRRAAPGRRRGRGSPPPSRRRRRHRPALAGRGLVGGDRVGQHRQRGTSACRRSRRPTTTTIGIAERRLRRAGRPRAGPRLAAKSSDASKEPVPLAVAPAEPQPQRHDEDRRRHERDEQQRPGARIPEDLLGVVRTPASITPMPRAWTTKPISSTRNGRDRQASRSPATSPPSLCSRVSVGALRVPATAPSMPPRQQQRDEHRHRRGSRPGRRRTRRRPPGAPAPASRMPSARAATRQDISVARSPGSSVISAGWAT